MSNNPTRRKGKKSRKIVYTEHKVLNRCKTLNKPADILCLIRKFRLKSRYCGCHINLVFKFFTNRRKLLFIIISRIVDGIRCYNLKRSL